MINKNRIIENIQKYGIFAYYPLYKQIEWTYDLVEKYKDQIIWERLMDDSNIIWDEDMLVKYDKYVPYKEYENGPIYPYNDYSSKKLTKYENLGFLSNRFLYEHKDVLDWKEVLKKCKFKWNKYVMNLFCRYLLYHDKKYIPGKEHYQCYDVEYLLDNEYFEWDAEKLYCYLQLVCLYLSLFLSKNKFHGLQLHVL